jgi:hypothetical protein
MRKVIIVGLLIINTWLSASVGIVKKTSGKVEVKRADKIVDVDPGFSLENGDIIMTKSKSSVGMIFDDGTTISLDEKAIFVINKFKVKPEKKEFDVDLLLKKGKALFSSGRIGKLAPKSVKFRIPEGIIGIRGTKFAVEVK